jgi:hypothetical protein
MSDVKTDRVRHGAAARIALADAINTEIETKPERTGLLRATDKILMRLYLAGFIIVPAPDPDEKEDA